MLEDLAGVAIRGYRAASFSIGRETLWAFDILADEGYVYISSIYPIHHDLYGMPEAPRHAFRVDADLNFLEIPISTVRVAGRNFPSVSSRSMSFLSLQNAALVFTTLMPSSPVRDLRRTYRARRH